MIRVKSAHPSFRKMVLVDEDFKASHLERPASSSQVSTPTICVSESPTQPLKVMSGDRPIATVEALATTPSSAKQTSATDAIRRSIKIRPVARSFTPGHAPKVLRLY